MSSFDYTQINPKNWKLSDIRTGLQCDDAQFEAIKLELWLGIKNSGLLGQNWQTTGSRTSLDRVIQNLKRSPKIVSILAPQPDSWVTAALKGLARYLKFDSKRGKSNPSSDIPPAPESNVKSDPASFAPAPSIFTPLLTDIFFCATRQETSCTSFCMASDLIEGNELEDTLKIADIQWTKYLQVLIQDEVMLIDETPEIWFQAGTRRVAVKNQRGFIASIHYQLREGVTLNYTSISAQSSK